MYDSAPKMPTLYIWPQHTKWHANLITMVLCNGIQTLNVFLEKVNEIDTKIKLTLEMENKVFITISGYRANKKYRWKENRKKNVQKAFEIE